MMAILSHYPMFQRLTKDWKYLTLVYMWSGLYYFAIQWPFIVTLQAKEQDYGYWVLSNLPVA